MSKANSSIRPYDILVVDDNENDLELFLRTLRRVQTDVETEINVCAASNGAQAASQLKVRKYDAIFLDINMAPPDGVELTKLIRASELNRATHIVIITGAEDRGLTARAFQAGANLFLFKPVDRTRLLRLIQVSTAPIDRERRRRQRVKVRCKVSVEYEQDRFDGETLDLSLGGMLMRANRILPVGSIVNVALLLPPATDSIRATARIVRVVGNEFMGLQFEQVGKAGSDRLGGFLVPMIVAATEGSK